MSDCNYLPLEKLLENYAKNSASFPDLGINYFQKYVELVNILKRDIYPQIDKGLIAHSSLVDEKPGLYTSHDESHFDEVVRFAGELLQINMDDKQQSSLLKNLTAYEIFLLLAAIRIHDIGNIDGREDHEKRCFSNLKNLSLTQKNWSDTVEKKEIAKIAEAHGGRLGNGSKDVISVLESKCDITSGYYRPQLLASILRFADEICELNNRANKNPLKVPEPNEIYHAYARSVASVKVTENQKSIKVIYKISAEDHNTKWGFGGGDKKYLLDEILSRLSKMDRERRYCNLYSRELYVVHSIIATIEILDTEYNVVESIPIELTDRGYPSCEEEALRKSIDIEKYLSAEFFQKLMLKGDKK